jgi:hypothetical protein
MQKRGRDFVVRIEIDGDERKGLSKINGQKPETTWIEINTNQDSYDVKSNKKKWPVRDVEYVDEAGSGNREFFEAWDNNNEYHDVSYIVTDAHGSEIYRDILVDAEISDVHTPDYDAASPVPNTVTFKLGHYKPIRV